MYLSAWLSITALVFQSELKSPSETVVNFKFLRLSYTSYVELILNIN